MILKFSCQNKDFKEVNGFNEYILRGYNDHDLINRIIKRYPSFKRTTIYDKINELEHNNELRVDGKLILLNNDKIIIMELLKNIMIITD